MGVVWVHWLMARGQILKDSLFLLVPRYKSAQAANSLPWSQEAGNQRLHQPFQPFHTQNGQYFVN